MINKVEGVDKTALEGNTVVSRHLTFLRLSTFLELSGESVILTAADLVPHFHILLLSSTCVF